MTASFFLFKKKSFVTCSVGIWKVGLAIIPFAIISSVTSLVSGQVVKYVGRIAIFTTVFLLDTVKTVGHEERSTVVALIHFYDSLFQ